MNKSTLDVLKELHAATIRMRSTPVVDDDFPEVIHNFDRALDHAGQHLVDGAFDAPFEMHVHPDFLVKLREANIARGREWCNGAEYGNTDREEILFRSNELGGETGELQNEIKKYARYLKGMKGGNSLALSQEKIADEVADVVICTDRIADIFGIDVQEAVRTKFNKTSYKNDLVTKL